MNTGMALKKRCGEPGFQVRMNEIVASVYRGRLNLRKQWLPSPLLVLSLSWEGFRHLL